MTEHEFRHSTLKYITKRIEARLEEKESHAKELEFLAWRTGYYVMPAIAVVFGNKGKNKYPDNPLKEKTVVVEDMELTEEEKEEWRSRIFGKLKDMGDKLKKNKLIEGE